MKNGKNRLHFFFVYRFFVKIFIFFNEKWEKSIFLDKNRQFQTEVPSKSHTQKCHFPERSFQAEKMGVKNIPIKRHYFYTKNRLFFSQGGDPYENQKRKKIVFDFFFFGLSKNSFFEDRNRRFLMGFLVKYREKKGERDTSVTRAGHRFCIWCLSKKKTLFFANHHVRNRA